VFPIPVADGRVLTVSRCDPPLTRVAGRECALPTSKVHKTLVSVAGRLNDDEWPTQLWGIACTATREVGSQRLDDVIGMSSVWLAWTHDIPALHAFRA
jgi:hypothetical protein